MNWLQLIIGSSVSVFVGGMIPVILFFLKERMEARKGVCEWFETIYIEDCTNELYEFFNTWALLSSLPARNVQELLANPIFSQVPSKQVGKLLTLVRGCSFQNWFNAMRAQWLRAVNQGDWNQLTKFHSHSASMANHLNLLREGLQGHKYRSKKDIYKVYQLACVKDFNQVVDQMTDDLQDDPNVRTYTAKQ